MLVQDGVRSKPLAIRPKDTADWQAPLANVQKVLDATAVELWRWFPERELDPVLVEPTGGPIVLFQRGAKGEYQVRLATGKTYWAQYAYQFAHELCHILCGYRVGEPQNKWFEESLCELASLFALRAMSETWKTKPPYPNWASYAPALADYARERMACAQLPAGQNLAQWYRANVPELRGHAALRDKNSVVATALLPLFEKEPEHWAAVSWLNAGAFEPERDFAAYLAAWHAQVPPRHRPFVRKIALELGIDLPATK